MRITPDHIETINEFQVFVFGSNTKGKHRHGSARKALEFGAEMGVSEGFRGESYAIPTTGGFKCLKTAVNRFIVFAARCPHLDFMVTKIGCGIAGYEPSDIAPLFRDAMSLENVYLPQEFWDILRK